MKKSTSVLCLFFFLFSNWLFAENGRVHIIPQPVSITEQPGAFTFSKTTAVVAESPTPEMYGIMQLFTQHITASKVNILCVTNKPVPATGQIDIYLNETPDNSIGGEGYTLTVAPKNIALHANTNAGILYGLQTLLQMLPADATAGLTIPCVQITDYPRFGWRGLMLDVSRHFFTKLEVEKYIDEMAQFKFNTLHLHLSDDNGWRIEIKSMPELTRTGAWRVKRTGRWGTFQQPQWGEPDDYGGFYTQDDMKEMLQYAAARNITILPEIDVPAHSLALIASYPNLSCTQMPYPVNAGANFYEQQDNALCVGNDSIFIALDKIFTEIAQLFPCQYIHVGGDEAYKGFWEKCPRCQKRMADEHLKNTDELQSYFVKRIEEIVNSKGKKMIGWDEILEGGLAPNATVMSWRGMEGGVKAAKLNHHVVMSPWGDAYLDLYQGDPNIEPATYGKLLLKTCYNFEPVPAGIDTSLILGGQANLWSESVPTFRHAEYMTWPRALAISEVLWSPKSTRNWDDFISRTETQFKKFDSTSINYSQAMYDAVITSKKQGDDTILIRLECQLTNADIYYTFDETNPDAFSHKYDGSLLSLPVGANDIRVVTYKNGKPIGNIIKVTKEQLADRVNDKPDW